MKDARKREVDFSVQPKDQTIEIDYKFNIHIVLVWYIRDYSINK